MSTTEAVCASSPAAAPERSKESKQKKKHKSDSHHLHEHRHRHTKKSKGSESMALSTSATTAAASATATCGEETEDWDENRAAVERLCAQYPNNVCCDCGESGTRWASVNHGVFVCIRCSGVHRSLGTHVSKVKSTNMDRWSLAEVRLMEAIGNTKGKTLYEARLPAGTRPPPSFNNSGVADDALKSFIRRKYVEREFAMHNLKDVLGRLYKETGYGRPPKKPSKSGDAAASSSSTREEAPIDRAAITGKRGDTVRALYGDAADEMTRGAAKHRKGGAAAAAAEAAAAAVDEPKRTFGAFGLVNVPADEYEDRWRRTLEVFAHVEAAEGAEEVAEIHRGGDESAQESATSPPASFLPASNAAAEKGTEDDDAVKAGQ
ncbi:putative GTPase activating protein for Arf [Lotmaria passim]